ncbi:uncharacterized protein LOC120649476 [Panicum virgatum]|uniref:Uncharacterized protein n=1 Tax=Panicum virgatum TaxID=38727 RepID=A0A8T0N8I4_PANVG|nr:uncharacterized protein LOC120649476 [Panicum virgatum]KAG2545263.1 hypothetical protein PVAP13_9KG420544 [Panicum virgatum]
MVANSSHYIAMLQVETFTSHPGTEPFASDSDVTFCLLLLLVAAAQSGGTSGSLNRPSHGPLCRHNLESNNAPAASDEQAIYYDSLVKCLLVVAADGDGCSNFQIVIIPAMHAC